MEEIKTYEGAENKRLNELRKVGIEIERREVINHQYQKLKMKLMFGDMPDTINQRENAEEGGATIDKMGDFPPDVEQNLISQ